MLSEFLGNFYLQISLPRARLLISAIHQSLCKERVVLQVYPSIKKGRPVSVAMVLVIALLFGLLSSAQYTRFLCSLSSARICSFTNPRLGLTRYAIKEVGPSKPELAAISVFALGSLPGIDTCRTPLRPAAAVRKVWPQPGQIQHRRIPARSPDDPDSL
jgi:hypothetical protein